MNATLNPFSSSRMHAVRFRPQGWNWPWLMERLAALDWRCAIVGLKGTGKTTLLSQLVQRFGEQGWRSRCLQLAAEKKSFSPPVMDHLCGSLTHSDIVVLDGAEQMGWLAWRRFCVATRKARGVIITTHAPGRLPTLVECTTSPELFKDVADELSGGSGPDMDTARRLYGRYRGNLRSAMRELYDRFSKEEL